MSRLVLLLDSDFVCKTITGGTMNMIRLGTALLLAAMYASAAAAERGASLKADAIARVLMEADLVFAEDSYRRGADAWGEVWAEHGMKPPFGEGRPVVGKEAVRLQMKPLYATPGFKLRWWPVRAEISKGGTLGYTWGRWTRTMQGADGRIRTTEGTYITVWEKQKNGEWKIIYDTGEGDSQK